MLQRKPPEFPYYINKKIELPYFPFWTERWFSDLEVGCMSREEKSMYLDLLCYQWREWGVPNDPEMLRDLLKLSKKKFEKVWKKISVCFEEKNENNSVTIRGRKKNLNRLINKKMEEDRAWIIENQLKTSETNRNNAIAGWETRRRKDTDAMRSHSDGNATDIPTESESDAETLPKNAIKTQTQNQTQTQTQSQSLKSPITHTLTLKGGKEDDFSQDGSGFGNGPLKNKPLKVRPDIRTKISKLANANEAAFDLSNPRDGVHVKKLFDGFMTLIQNFPEEELLGLILQIRDTKPNDPVAYFVSIFTREGSHSAPDTTRPEVKGILRKWYEADKKPAPVDDLVKNLTDSFGVSDE